MSPTAQEYRRRINRVMDFVERHLDEPLPLERLADVATFSRYHFHRIFTAHVGETPGQFVQRLRVERAALLLAANPARTVLEVALEVGFGDPAAFSRAFARLYGASPTAYRRERRNLGTALRNHGTEPGLPESVPDSKLRVSCGITVPDGTEGSGEVCTMSLAGGSYAEARFEVDADEFGGAWAWLYGEWLPASGYQPDDRLCFERYAGDPKPAEDGGALRFSVDICVPVTPL